jgi:hypothetical protein
VLATGPVQVAAASRVFSNARRVGAASMSKELIAAADAVVMRAAKYAMEHMMNEWQPEM